MSSTATQLHTLDLSKLESAAVRTEPFEFLLVDDILQKESKQPIVEDFPEIDRIGSFPLSTLKYGPAFSNLIEELLGKEFESAIGRKFGLDLSQMPTMFTVRGQCSATSDGHIHTDSRDKVITVFLYLNPDWDPKAGGRLRLLRSKNLEDVAAEVPPTMGSLLVFKRSDRSWHGHKPFEGKRMSLQMNWVKSDRYMKKEQRRHQWSSFIKRLFGRSTYEG